MVGRSKSSSLVVFAVVSLMSMGCATTGKQEKTLTSTERAKLFIDIANGSIIEGDPTAALNYLAQAEALDNTRPDLYHSKALAYCAKHDTKSALVAARKTVAMAPNYSDANNTLGRILLDVGKSDEAAKYLAMAADDALYAESYKAQTNLGILYYRRGDYSKAMIQVNRAIQSNPNLGCVAYYYRGHLMLRENHFKEAARDYEHATQRFCASFADAHFALGVAYFRNKQYDLARKKFLEIKQRYPNTEMADQAMDRLRYIP